MRKEKGRVVGYARGFPVDLSVDRQVDALRSAGAARVFVDQAPGAVDGQPELDRCLALLQAGDTLVVWRMDCLAPSVADAAEIVGGLASSGITFRSLVEGIDTSAPDGDAALAVFAAEEQVERRHARDGATAGAESRPDAARRGRPPVLNAEQAHEAVRMNAEGMTQSQIAATLGVGRTTVGRYLKALAPRVEAVPDTAEAEAEPQARSSVDDSGVAVRPQRQPSLTDVADLVGVSYQTVSRVVNDHPKVSARTRARVLAALEEVGYRRNLAARSLVTRRTGALGIVSDGSPRYGPLRTLIALEIAARASGYTVTVLTVDAPYESSIPAAMAKLEEVGVEGVVVIATRLAEARAVRATSVRVPVEMIAAGESEGPGLLTYYEDQELGARLATRHLLRLGHTDIVHLSGSMEWFDGIVRRRGYESEMWEAGLEPRWFEGDWSPGWAYEMGLRFVSDGVPQAIFAASDHTALGLFRAFSENGIRVPDDVSVVGFDDIEGADYFYPPLTTVRQDFDALARRAIDLLLAAIAGRTADPTPLVPSFTIRSSTAPARVGS